MEFGRRFCKPLDSVDLRCLRIGLLPPVFDRERNVLGGVMDGVTAVLTAYRRPNLLGEQIRAIRAQTEAPAEIWVWANEPSFAINEALEAARPDRVVRSSRNAFVHARFALALLAPTEFVALFDDDTIPGQGWLANCLETFAKTHGILGSAGVRLQGEDYRSRTVHGWHDPIDEAVEVDLVGHAWFLKTAWVPYLFAAPPVTGTNGEDIELSARAWRLGGIRTYCPPHPPWDRSLWGSLRGVELGDDPVALSRRPSHLDERDRIVRAEQAAGWKPCFARRADPIPPRNAAPEIFTGRVENTSSAEPNGRDLEKHSDSNVHPGALAGRTEPEVVVRGVADDSADAFTRRQDQAGTRSDQAGGYGEAGRAFWKRTHVAGHRILVIGQDIAGIGEMLRERRPAKLVGVELDPSCVERAEKRFDEAQATDEEGEGLSFSPAAFDGIVCGDLLERVRRPARLLGKMRGWLAPGGRLLANVSNVRRHTVVESLLAGEWRGAEVERGRRPLRFFTRREIEKLLYRAGFGEPSFTVLPDTGHASWVKAGRPGEIRLGQLHVGGLPPDEAEEFFARGYLVEAAPAEAASFGTTSIVIVTHNQLAYTQQCLDSVRRLTDEPYELILVDNASSDGTVDYFRTVRGAKLIVNSENRGFPAAVNQGIASATGDQILLLNNDTVVTTGWLRRMLTILHSDPQIGLVGPCSNFVSGSQQVEVRYDDDLCCLDGFAWEWGKAHDRIVEDAERLIGFCLLIRRSVVHAVGTLDERFGIGCFEDDDYCLRANAAGFRTVIARDAFVHHYGGRTFVGSGVDFARVMRENERKFREKWAEKTPNPTVTALPAALSIAPQHSNGRPAPAFTAVMAPKGGLLLQRKNVKLSLCMIVRDSSRTLPACLESILPWVDEMVIVDTGSVDETPTIVQSFGGRLFHFPWCDDFSAARNESLKPARGEWLFWMDSDDTIDPSCGRRLRDLVYGEHDPSVLGYVVQVHCPGRSEDGSRDITAVDHVKLFRNRPDLRFDGRIHEQILPAIRQANGEVAWTDLFVVHSGSDQSSEAQDRKRERDLRILHRELEERPNHPFTLFNLGMTYSDGERFEEAVDFLAMSIARSGPQESHLRKVYALLVYSQMRLGRKEEASATCKRGLDLFPEDAELRFRQGVLLHDLGCLVEAARAYQDVLANKEPRHFSSVDQGIFGFKARQNLAVIYTAMGRESDAEQEWRRVVQEIPSYRQGWRGLGDALMRQNKTHDLTALIEQMLSEESLRGEAHLIKGRLAVMRGLLAEARQHFDSAVAAYPRDTEPRQALCQFLFEHGTLREAEQALKDLIGCDPTDASAHHNLGTHYMRTHRYRDAVRAYRESLRFRPSSATTHLYLGFALKESDQVSQAISAWEEVLRLSPGNAAAQEELRKVGRHAMAARE